MAKRRRMSRKSSNKNYRRGSKVKRQNTSHNPVRGGWRL